MTYRDKCNRLHKEVVTALSRHHRARAVINNGYEQADRKKYIDRKGKTYTDWKEARQKYNDFLDLVVKLGKDLDDTMPADDN